jgi:hypothetical protein
MPRSHSCRSFWLDGHFSGSKFETSRIDIDSPVIRELHTVLSLTNSDNSVIAIDDARMFLGHHNCRSLSQYCYIDLLAVVYFFFLQWNI